MTKTKGYKLIFEVIFPGEPQQKIISRSQHANIIMSAYAGWYQWTKKDHVACIWKLELYEGNRLLKRAGANTWELNQAKTIN